MKKRDLVSRLVTPTGTKGCASHVGAGCTFCPGWCYQPGQKVLFCPGCQTRDKRAPPFVPDWRSRLGNRDNSGFPTGTNQRFCSSVSPLPISLIACSLSAAVSHQIKLNVFLKKFSLFSVLSLNRCITEMTETRSIK